MEAIAASSLPMLSHFGAQDLANTSWAFATRLFLDPPLMQSLAASAIPRLSDYDAQDLANTSWAYAPLSVNDSEPLLESIAAAAIALISAFCT